MLLVQKATCSVSAKKLSTQRSRTRRPTRRIGISSSGISLVAIEHIEFKLVGKFVVEELKPKFPLRETARLDRVPQIPSMKVGIRAIDFHGFVPDNGLQSEFRLPMEFHEGGFSCRCNQPIGVHTKSFHEAETAGNCAIRHCPHDHVHAFGHQRDEVPEIVVCGLRLREIPIRFGFCGMNKVGKLHSVLDKKDGNVISNNVPVSLFCIKLHCESTDITCEIGGSFVSCNC